MNWKKSAGWEESRWFSAIRNMGKKQWLILFLTGALLAVIAMPVKKGDTAAESPSGSLSLYGGSGEEEGGEALRLQQELEAILRQVEGVGEVKVMRTLKGSSGTIYGTGAQEAEVAGVLLAAEGAEDLTVVQNIQEAVQALFQVEAHKIKVMKLI